MQAVILAGGKGTRLRPYTIALPKPLVPIGEKPILEIVLKNLKNAGVTNVTIAVNHMADIIMAYFKNGEKYGLHIEYSFEEKPLSTVAPIKLIDHLPENFLVLNGDVLTDIDFNDLYQHHIQSGAELTVATYNRKTKIDFGVLDVNEKSNQVVGFKEKPEYDFKVSMGIYVFKKTILNLVPYNEAYGFDNLVLDMLAKDKPINVYPFTRYWLDIGRPDDYEKANADMKNNMGDD